MGNIATCKCNKLQESNEIDLNKDKKELLNKILSEKSKINQCKNSNSFSHDEKKYIQESKKNNGKSNDFLELDLKNERIIFLVKSSF